MKTLYTIFFIALTSILISSCAVQSDDGASEESQTNEEGVTDNSQNISVFVDAEEQKGSIKIDENTKIDVSQLKESPDVITEIDGEPACASSNVTFTEEIKQGISTKPQILDVTIDLTRFGTGEEMDELTKNRVTQIGSLINGELYEKISMNEGDSMILRFLGTLDYGKLGKNIPLNDRIMIKLSKKSGKVIKISNIECVENKRKKLIYLKMNKKDMGVIDAASEEDENSSGVDVEKIKYELNSVQKFNAADTDEVLAIVSKEFDLRYNSDKFSMGTFMIEFLDQADILSTEQKNVKTFIFSDANFNLHPNFRKNYKNVANLNLDKIGDFNSDVYNKYPAKFSSFYKNVTEDKYFASVKEKCKTNKTLYMIGTKNGTNKYFDTILEGFYTKILPSCTIKFN